MCELWESRSKKTTYLAKLVCAIKHIVSRTPADVAVQGDHEGYRDASFHLKLFEIFDTLPRTLDLLEEESKAERKRSCELP
jgi:hypothetical protein